MTNYLGKSIGENQLIELIGQDEHTLQIKAFQPGKDRYVAFTMLKPHAAKDSVFVQQFLNAAKIASELQHENIMPVYDYGQHEGIFYSVSPLMEMGTLRGNLGWFYDLQNAVHLISQISEGLTYLHARRYIHGNLKSTNVYLDSQHRPMLSGFGGSMPSGQSARSLSHPEQVQGGVVDQRTDVFALGVLLYELLTGMLPPVGIVAKPSAIRSDLPEAIDRIVLKAMAHNPDHRFQNPAEFNNALMNAVGIPEPTPAAHVSTPPSAPGVSQSVNVHQTKGTNWTAIILSVVLIGVLIALAVLVIPRLGQDDDVDINPTEPIITQPIEPTVEQPTVEQPTDPPSEQPTEIPAEQPTKPGLDLPEDLPDFCNSIGFAAGIAGFGIVAAYKKKIRDQ